MALTETEENRLAALEEKTRALALLISGGGSKNQLNRLLVLAGDEARKLTIRIEGLETLTAEILELARKLQ